MSWFSGLTDGKTRPGDLVRIDLDDRFLSIPARSYFGPYARSPNGRYLLTWRDGNDAGTVGGARGEGQGLFLLLEEGRILCEGRIDRPNDGKVADDGTFVLNDWHFFTMELRGTFCAFKSDGEPILRRRFKANLYNNGLSADGRWACCQTCNSDDEADSSVLTIFDLKCAKEVASWSPESGWANEYLFGSAGTIFLTYGKDQSLAYSLSGEFLDRKRWIKDGIARGDFRRISLSLKESPESLPSKDVLSLVAACDRGLEMTENSQPWSQAWGWRLKGECYDRGADLSEALRCYEKALENDPKIGVKRRTQQIRKLLSKKP